MDPAAPDAGASSSDPAQAARAGGEPRCGEGEEGSATRGGRKPDSCRGGGGGGLLGTETRDAVAAEKSLITHSAGGGHHPGRAHPRSGVPAASPPRTSSAACPRARDGRV